MQLGASITRMQGTPLCTISGGLEKGFLQVMSPRMALRSSWVPAHVVVLGLAGRFSYTEPFTLSPAVRGNASSATFSFSLTFAGEKRIMLFEWLFECPRHLLLGISNTSLDT